MKRIILIFMVFNLVRCNLCSIHGIPVEEDVDYCIISKDFSALDFPLVFGQKLYLVSCDRKQLVEKRVGVFRGLDAYSCSDSYVCYKYGNSGPFYDKLARDYPDRLYVDELGGRFLRFKRTKVIDDVEYYNLIGEHIFYISSTDDDRLYYQNLTTGQKTVFDYYKTGKDNISKISFQNIKMKGEKSCYMLSNDLYNVWKLNLESGDIERAVQMKERMIGLVIWGDNHLLLYTETGKLIECNLETGEKEIITEGLNTSIYQKYLLDEARTAKCPFDFGNEGKLYYDKEGELYVYDFSTGKSELFVKLDDDVIDYRIGRNQLMVFRDTAFEGESVSFYNYQGKHLRTYRYPKEPGWLRRYFF